MDRRAWLLGGILWLTLAGSVSAQDSLLSTSWSFAPEIDLEPKAFEPEPPATNAPVVVPQPARPRQIPSQARNAIAFYSRSRGAEQSLQAMPGRSRMMRATAVSPAGGGSKHKPFQGASQRTTVSPYLNLYIEEQADAPPNYFSFVRPQLQQQQTNFRQQHELQRLRRQVRRVPNAAATSPAGGTAPTGHSSRFLNTGQYYGGFSSQ